MNQKKWLAIAIAVAIMIVSMVVPSPQVKSFDKERQFDQVANYFVGNDNLTEAIETAGDTGSRILVLSLNGVIASSSGSLMSATEYDHTFMLDQLAAVLNDQTIKAILFTVNTPGGGVYESAEIRNALAKIKRERDIPIYVSMLNLAASGGYYVSAEATKIYATEETWTGSIGVIMQSLNLSGLLEKYGIESQTYKSGALKDMGSSYKEPSEEEKRVFQSLIDESYDKFVKIIADGRQLSEDEVRKIADGRIYTAKQALENKLIDAIAYPDQVLAELMTDYDLADATVFKYEKQAGNEFLDLFKQLNLTYSNANELNQLKQFLGNHYHQTPMPYYLYGGQ